MYINDIPNCLENANIKTFADNTTLFYSSNSLQDLEKTINEEFNHLLSYCSPNKLSVNLKENPLYDNLRYFSEGEKRRPEIRLRFAG